MTPLHLVRARGRDVVGALAVVHYRVVDINTAPGSEHLLYADAYLVLWGPRLDRGDLNGPQESAGQHQVRELVCRWTHTQMSGWHGRRIINGKIHVLHLLGRLKFVSKSSRSRP